PGPTAIYQPTPQASQPSQPPHQAQGDAQPHLGEGQWDMSHANGDASGRQEPDAAADEAHDLPHPMLLDDLMPDGPGQAGVARPRLSPLELQHQMEEKLRKLRQPGHSPWPEHLRCKSLSNPGLSIMQQEAARMAAALDESMAAQEKEALRLQQAMEQDRRALATVNSLRDEIRAEGLDILRQQQLDFNQALKETTSQGWAQLTTVAAAFAEQLKSNHVAHAAIQTIPTDLLQGVDTHPLSPPRPAAHEPGHTMQQPALRLPLPIPAGAINQDGAYLTRDGRAGQPFMDSPRSEGSSSAYSQDFSVRGTVAGTELTASIPAQGQGWRTVPGLSSPGVMDEQGPSYLSQASRQLHTTTIISEEFQVYSEAASREPTSSIASSAQATSMPATIHNASQLQTASILTTGMPQSVSFDTASGGTGSSPETRSLSSLQHPQRSGSTAATSVRSQTAVQELSYTMPGEVTGEATTTADSILPDAPAPATATGSSILTGSQPLTASLATTALTAVQTATMSAAGLHSPSRPSRMAAAGGTAGIPLSPFNHLRGSPAGGFDASATDLMQLLYQHQAEAQQQLAALEAEKAAAITAAQHCCRAAQLTWQAATRADACGAHAEHAAQPGAVRPGKPDASYQGHHGIMGIAAEHSQGTSTTDNTGLLLAPLQLQQAQALAARVGQTPGKPQASPAPETGGGAAAAATPTRSQPTSSHRPPTTHPAQHSSRTSLPSQRRQSSHPASSSLLQPSCIAEESTSQHVSQSTSSIADDAMQDTVYSEGFSTPAGSVLQAAGQQSSRFAATVSIVEEEGTTEATSAVGEVSEDAQHMRSTSLAGGIDSHRHTATSSTYLQSGIVEESPTTPHGSDPSTSIEDEKGHTTDCTAVSDAPSRDPTASAPAAARLVVKHADSSTTSSSSASGQSSMSDQLSQEKAKLAAQLASKQRELRSLQRRQAQKAKAKDIAKMQRQLLQLEEELHKAKHHTPSTASAVTASSSPASQQQPTRHQRRQSGSTVTSAIQSEAGTGKGSGGSGQETSTVQTSSAGQVASTTTSSVPSVSVEDERHEMGWRDCCFCWGGAARLQGNLHNPVCHSAPVLALQSLQPVWLFCAGCKAEAAGTAGALRA
ncbi:hypothetical protein HaLaN_27607, partial [Haematococcus lacustris]